MQKEGIFLTEVEALKHKRNNVSPRSRETEERKNRMHPHIIAEMGKVSSKIKELDSKLSEIDEKLQYYQMTIPNVYHESTPVGKDEEDNILVEEPGVSLLNLSMNLKITGNLVRS